MPKSVPAWDKRSGKKLTYSVPENYFDLFPNLSRSEPKSTPKTASKAADKKEA